LFPFFTLIDGEIMVKRAQGMSLNVIIIAALALIVLVVLTAIFIGRLGSFDDTVPKEAGARYQALSIMFGKCQPGLADEQQFYNLWGDGEDSEQLEALEFIDDRADECNDGRDSEANCESYGCNWD